MSATNERNERLGKGYPYTLRPELHKALKARGVDYWVAQGLTFWNCPDGRECVAYGYQSNGKPMLAVKIVGITDPEQAIAATLGHDQRNCRNISDFNPVDVFTCSECGSSFKVCQFKIDADGILDDETEFEFVPMHCPRCEAKVINE